MTDQAESPAIPAGAPTPTDRKKKKSVDARKAEADGFALMEICGIELKIPVGKRVPLKAILRFRGLNDDMTPLDGDPEFLGSAELLGKEQWAEFLAKDPTAEDFGKIGQTLLDLLGN